MGPIVVVLETSGIGKPITMFSNRHYRVEISIFFNYFIFCKEPIGFFICKTYSSIFETARIGCLQ